MEWLLEIALIVLLAATLFHALRLERALGVLKRDRAALDALVADFNASTHAAEQGIDRLHEAADGAGRLIARHVDSATRLKDDLLFLNDRGEKLADRLDRLVRAARALDQQAPRMPDPPPEPPSAWDPPPPAPALSVPPANTTDDSPPRVRSQAERDLLKALRLAR